MGRDVNSHGDGGEQAKRNDDGDAGRRAEGGEEYRKRDMEVDGEKTEREERRNARKRRWEEIGMSTG